MQAKRFSIQSSVLIKTQFKLQSFPLLFGQHVVETGAVNSRHPWRLIVDNEPNKSRFFTSIDGTIRSIPEVSKQTVRPVEKRGEHATCETTVHNFSFQIVLTEGQLNIEGLAGQGTCSVPYEIAVNIKRGPGLNPVAQRIIIFVWKGNAD